MSYAPLLLGFTFRKSGPGKSCRTNSLTTCGGGFVDNTRRECGGRGDAQFACPFKRTRRKEGNGGHAPDPAPWHRPPAPAGLLPANTEHAGGPHTSYSPRQDSPGGDLVWAPQQAGCTSLSQAPQAPLTHIPSLSALLS